MAFCDDQQIMRKHDRFFRDRAHLFQGFHADDEDKSHAVHEAFQEYEKLFEDTVAAFLEEEQRSVKHDDASLNLSILLSALDFDWFCRFLELEAIKTQQAMKAAEDMGL
ncbi:hypothetical protein PINS_up004558 [Pythium insidiosum]|nr:hypothetical protein PINS_up004558 [Pythium insidiosum]